MGEIYGGEVAKEFSNFLKAGWKETIAWATTEIRIQTKIKINRRGNARAGINGRWPDLT